MHCSMRTIDFVIGSIHNRKLFEIVKFFVSPIMGGVNWEQPVFINKIK